MCNVSGDVSCLADFKILVFKSSWFRGILFVFLLPSSKMITDAVFIFDLGRLFIVMWERQLILMSFLAKEYRITSVHE